jgi:hypothetical protein
MSNELTSLPEKSFSHILEVVCSLAAGPTALKNPHLRASLAELLVCLLPQDRVASESHVFNTHPLLRESLVPTLIELYCSVEDGHGSVTSPSCWRALIATRFVFSVLNWMHVARVFAAAGCIMLSTLRAIRSQRCWSSCGLCRFIALAC